MALISQDIEKIREAVYGIEMREPIADALTQINNAYNGMVIGVSTEARTGNNAYALKIRTKNGG